jgi:threonine/homoserine/homoserine lactone efflux protein
MPSLELLLAFAAATAVFAYMPGPALLYTAAQTLARGRRAGFMAALGIHLGCYAHVLAAAFGLSAVFRHVPELYVAVKVVGAVYLVWLGIGMMRRREPEAGPGKVEPKSAGRAFIESIAVELLNPKVAIFFIAFLPQFVDPQASLPIWAQFLILGTIVNFAFSSADVVTVLAASAMLKRLRSGGTGQRILRYAGGSVLIGLGARLGLERG